MRRAARPRAVWLLTVPVEQPSVSATCSTDRSATNRSTSTARCPGGTASSADRSAMRSSDPASACATVSGSSATTCSRARPRRFVSRKTLVRTVRRYASTVSMRTFAQRAYIFTNAVCAISSASGHEPHMANAIRRAPSKRAEKNSANSWSRPRTPRPPPCLSVSPSTRMCGGGLHASFGVIHRQDRHLRFCRGAPVDWALGRPRDRVGAASRAGGLHSVAGSLPVAGQVVWASAMSVVVGVESI